VAERHQIGLAGLLLLRKHRNRVRPRRVRLPLTVARTGCGRPRTSTASHAFRYVHETLRTPRAPRLARAGADRYSSCDHPTEFGQWPGAQHCGRFRAGHSTMTNADSTPTRATRTRRLPFLQGLAPVERSRIPADVLAGVTLAALGIPEVMGYTKIAGMPVITGLYTIFLPIAVFALLGSSRHLIVGADSATAAILAAGLAGMAPIASPQYVALAGALAILTGAFLVLARIFRLGFLANFLSRSVLIGFLTGVGIQVAMSRSPACWVSRAGAAARFGSSSGRSATSVTRAWRPWPCRCR
jgi:hypothetical protein